MSGIWLPGSALIISVFLTFLFFLKNNSQNEETKIYKYLVIFNLLYSFLGVLGYVVAINFGSIYITGVIQSFYLVVMNIIILLILLYAMTISNLDSKIENIFKKIFTIFTIIIIVFILILPIDTIITENTLDVNGPAYYAAMVGIITYVPLILAFYIRYIFSKGFNYKKCIPFFVLLIMFIFGLILRKYYPEVITETFIFSFYVLVMYHTIENPDVKMIRELEIAKNEADRANQAKSDFLSSMSHEIRTPLNAIVGLSQDLLEDANCPDSMKEDLSDIVSASETLLEIVGNILDISKIESNNMEINEHIYNYRDEITKLAKLDSTRIGDKNIKLTVDFANDLPYELIGDKVHVKQIVNNLLTNAIKYTDSGYIKLSTKCINDVKNMQTILYITCQDTGRGIKKENISKLFTKFERLDIEKNSTTEGTGLGLAITKQLVEMMNGKINLSSTYGEGTIFVVELPQKIKSMTKPQEVVTNQSKEDVNYQGCSVLIVDDNKLNIKVARRCMTSLGFICSEAMSGAEAIELTKNNHYDLILMDIMMPNMGGEECFKIIREEPNFNSKVIALTADAISGAEDKYRSEGFDEYISKPFTKTDMIDKLKKINFK